jgi:hypothetical protein
MRFEMARHLGPLRRESARIALRGAAPGPTLVRAALEAAAPDVLPPEFSKTDYVHFLLYIDAEIEHGLMVQYLYAAYSLGGPQVPERYRAQIQGWREVILGIAKEEMGHLISVQNILRLLGGPLDFGRDDFPWTSPFYPFPFSLEPLTMESLAAYVYAEAPVEWTGEDADEIKRIVKAITSDPHQVSALFEQMIRLMKNPNFIPDDLFQPKTWPFQANWDEWGRGYQGGNRGDSTGANPPGAPDVLVMPVASRDDAVASLGQIAEQGEDTSTADPSKLSHFARFLKIFHEWKELLPVFEREGWQPARNVASNPYIPAEDGAEPQPEKSCGRTRDAITNREAQRWANLFNVRYRMLLNFLTHSYDLAAGEGQAGPRSPRATIINATFGEMYNLRAIANILVQTPLSDDPKLAGRTAGAPFQMPYTLRRPMGDANLWRLHKELLLASRQLISELLKLSPEPRHRYLISLREADNQLLGLIDQILDGYKLPSL